MMREVLAGSLGLLEDAALVQEDLTGLSPRISALLDAEGPALAGLVRELTTLAESNAAQASSIAGATSKVLEKLAGLKQELAKERDRLVEAGEIWASGLQSSHDALAAGEQAADAWRRPAAEIGQVVQLATDLAEQTRILGVNASIEALRSGEAGRGFMLIAEEAERLSDRMLKVAHQIAAQVEEGEQASGRLMSSLAEARAALILADGAGRRINPAERVDHPRDVVFPREEAALLPGAFSRMAADTRLLQDRLDTAWQHLDGAAAREAMQAATRLFSQASRLASMARSCETKMAELDKMIHQPEAALALWKAMERRCDTPPGTGEGAE
jgi:hypothetical protein